jgi:hypothetical protein
VAAEKVSYIFCTKLGKRILRTFGWEKNNYKLKSEEKMWEKSS